MFGLVFGVPSILHVLPKFNMLYIGIVDYHDMIRIEQ